MKEQARLKAHTQMLKKKTKKILSLEDMKKFANMVHKFQIDNIGRDLPPNVQKIVNNLTCNEHKFMYCPSCKNFNDADFNPMENIQKFMRYVETEEKKW